MKYHFIIVPLASVLLALAAWHIRQMRALAAAIDARGGLTP